MTNNTTTNTTATITILKTTERGAHLITDGVRVAWIMGRSRRSDGTFTPSAYSALAEGKPYAEWEQEEERRRLWKEDREKARELAFQEGKQPTSVTIDASRVRDYSEKAWKVRTNATKWMYGKLVSVYEYLPKSLVSVQYTGATAVITLPKWYLEKNGWLSNLRLTA